MKCILLAAGYATRLYPLTKDKPKSLLEVGGKTILENIVEKIACVDSINEICIVTNAKFTGQFQQWANGYSCSKDIIVINDGTTSNENRLGAIADIDYAVRSKEIAEDILVMAGDNLFDFDLRDFIDYFQAKDADCITIHELSDLESLRRTGVAEIDQAGKVISFQEKPINPRSNLAVPPFYIFKSQTLSLIRGYLMSGNNPDAPGNFIPWLIGKKDVYAFKFEGRRYDIGTLESYKTVQREFERR